ncbi:flagella associated protein, partial [Cystoisospora suis]
MEGDCPPHPSQQEEEEKKEEEEETSLQSKNLQPIPNDTIRGREEEEGGLPLSSSFSPFDSRTSDANRPSLPSSDLRAFSEDPHYEGSEDPWRGRRGEKEERDETGEGRREERTDDASSMEKEDRKDIEGANGERDVQDKEEEEDQDEDEEERRNVVSYKGEERRCSTDSCSGYDNFIDRISLSQKEVLLDQMKKKMEMDEDEEEGEHKERKREGDEDEEKSEERNEQDEMEEEKKKEEEGAMSQGEGDLHGDRRSDESREEEEEEKDGEDSFSLKADSNGERKEEDDKEEEERSLFLSRAYHHSFGEPVRDLARIEEQDGVSVHLKRYHHSFGEPVDDVSIELDEEEKDEEPPSASHPDGSPPLSPSEQPLLLLKAEDEEEEEDISISPIARYKETEEACHRQLQEQIRELGKQENEKSHLPPPSLLNPPPPSSTSSHSSSSLPSDIPLSSFSFHPSSAAPAPPSSSSFPSPLDDADLLPPFANEENRRLHEDIVKSRGEIRYLNSQIAERQDRTKMMEVHLKNLLAELKNIEKIQQAKTDSIQSERHISDLHERHTGKIASQIKQLDAEVNRFEDRLLAVQEEFLKKNEEIDKFKLLMNWNEKELKQWITAETQQQ